jgi:hypothetical protein
LIESRQYLCLQYFFVRKNMIKGIKLPLFLATNEVSLMRK